MTLKNNAAANWWKRSECLPVYLHFSSTSMLGR